ncbi:MAG TPA: zinc ABC transporter substrate-binding protein [Candidatus Hydrogenedens sp.]|nr:zinc ABC transporter substrate-binding protein [Candidatus Hydrogenedens sp.]
MIFYNYQRFLIVLVLLISICCAFATSHLYADEIIVVGTSAIHSAIKNLTGKDTELAIVVPPDLCPGHFDLKPGDIEKFLNAKLIILHTWQKELPSIKSLIRGTNPPKEKVAYIQVEGNWFVPQNYIRGLEEIGKVLITAGLLTEEDYKKQFERRKNEILAFEQQTIQKVKKYNPEDIHLISSTFQSDFVNWLGFKVVATFPRTDEFNLSSWGELLNKGKKEHVNIVVENLQNDEIEIVKKLSSELNAEPVILSSFPYTCPTCNSWEISVENNITTLLNAINNKKK